jgi:hypothetical protein
LVVTALVPPQVCPVAGDAAADPAVSPVTISVAASAIPVSFVRTMNPTLPLTDTKTGRNLPLT